MKPQIRIFNRNKEIAPHYLNSDGAYACYVEYGPNEARGYCNMNLAAFVIYRNGINRCEKCRVWKNGR